MTELIMTLGLPASGKSTWAEQHVRESRNTCVRVTKDQLRVMLNASPAGRGKAERNVLKARDALVGVFLQAGVSVIVDDTNFNPVHRTRLEQLAQQHGAQFRVRDFTDVGVDECVRRDASRSNSVGETVIRRMWQQYLYQPPAGVPGSAGLPDAVIVDIDGTLARMNGRSPYAWDQVHTDTPNPHIVWLVQTIAAAGTQVLFLSGRDEVCRDATQAWLDEHVGLDGPLWMRPQKDMRPDQQVKEELYRTHIEGRFNVVTVFDDRDQVVALWRARLGVPCLQVEYGAF